MDSNRSDQALTVSQWAHPYQSAEQRLALKGSTRLSWGERVVLQLMLWLMFMVVAVVVSTARLLPLHQSDHGKNVGPPQSERAEFSTDSQFPPS